MILKRTLIIAIIFTMFSLGAIAYNANGGSNIDLKKESFLTSGSSKSNDIRQKLSIGESILYTANTNFKLALEKDEMYYYLTGKNGYVVACPLFSGSLFSTNVELIAKVIYDNKNPEVLFKFKEALLRMMAGPSFEDLKLAIIILSYYSHYDTSFINDNLARTLMDIDDSLSMYSGVDDFYRDIVVSALKSLRARLMDASKN